MQLKREEIAFKREELAFKREELAVERVQVVGWPDDAARRGGGESWLGLSTTPHRAAWWTRKQAN
jgi:hypothetical protein